MPEALHNSQITAAFLSRPYHSKELLFMIVCGMASQWFFLNTEAGCVEETGFCMQEWMQSVQDTSATNNANRRLFRELDDRYRGHSLLVAAYQLMILFRGVCGGGGGGAGGAGGGARGGGSGTWAVAGALH